MIEFFFVRAYSLIKIPDFGWGVLTGLITTLVLFIVRWVGRRVHTLMKMYERFTLAGFWIGKCTLPHYPTGEEAIEIYRLKTTGDYVTFKFFNYLRPRPEIMRYDGAGISRSQLFSAFYYVPSRNSSESGVFSVRKSGDCLKGTYAQFDLKDNEKLEQSRDDFMLTRIQLPRFARLKMRLNRPPYRTYEEAKAKYDAALKANGSPDVAKPELKPQV